MSAGDAKSRGRPPDPDLESGRDGDVVIDESDKSQRDSLDSNDNQRQHFIVRTPWGCLVANGVGLLVVIAIILVLGGAFVGFMFLLSKLRVGIF